MKKTLFITLFLPVMLWAQEGGSFTFQALNLVNSARTAALGGYNVSTADGDVSVFTENPALLDSVANGDATVLYNPFFSDINAFTGQYASEVGGLGVFGFGLTYINYGTFTQTDETGAESGSFTAQDFVLSVGKAHRVGPFVLGGNLKFIQSGIAGYSASAAVLDIGGIYKLPKANFTAGLAISNLGVIFADYTELGGQLPLNVTAGITFKPEGMPIRFTLTGHNLTDSNDAFFETDDNPNFADQVFKRMSIGGEILFSKNVNVLIGYDHNRKRELTLEETAGGAGFSYGIMIRMKKYQFRFSRATYQAAGGTSFISLQSNLKDIKKIF